MPQVGEVVHKRGQVVPVLALLTLVAIVWARIFSVPVHDWDDRVYLFEDPRLEELSLRNLWAILTKGFFANYHPVTTLTYLFDRTVWGRWVPGFHLTHLAFYATGVVILYMLFCDLLRSRPAAFAAAATYAVHTIHVEPVAWLAQRKDVVCLPFYAAAILAYVRSGSNLRMYVASVALAGAAMLSKGYAVILPAVLLAYDACYARCLGKKELLNKLPFVAMAAFTTAATVMAQDKDSALISIEMTAWQRFVLLAKVFAVYVARALVPVRLSASYEVGHDWLGWWAAASGMVLGAGLVAGFFLLRKRLPPVALGLALFALPLATVMNVFFTLRIWIADRYLFFPTIGSCLALAGLGCLIASRLEGRPARKLVPAAASAVIALYSVLTVERIGVWTSGVRLWSDVLRKRLDLPGEGPVRARDLWGRSIGELEPLFALVRAWEKEGYRSEAEEILEELRRASGDLSGVGGEVELARLDIEGGRPEEAIRRLTPLTESHGWLAPIAWEWIAVAHETSGRLDSAREAYRKAFELYRLSGRSGAEALIGEAGLEFRAGNYAKAEELYTQALKLAPRDQRAKFFLGRCLEESSRLEEAYALYAESLRLEPAGLTHADIHLQMGIAAEKLGRHSDAIAHFEEVLRSDPAHPQREGVRAKLDSLRSRQQVHCPEGRSSR